MRCGASLSMVLVAALAGVGCAGGLADAKRQFDQGLYPEAKATFASLERESTQWDRRRRAQYALYRGLTFDALGDVARAASWLRQAQASESGRPGTLPPDDVRRRYYRSLSNLPGFVALADRAIFVDNSTRQRRKMILEIVEGQVTFRIARMPSWLKRSLPLVSHRKRSRGR